MSAIALAPNSGLSLGDLNGENGPYIKRAEYTIPIGDKFKTILKFELRDLQGNTIAAAASLVDKLLKENQSLIPIFDIKKIQITIRNKKYLIINDRAVCLSYKSGFHLKHQQFLDHFFSGELITTPYKCDHSHLFDLDSIKLWRKKEKNCPCDGHEISSSNFIIDQNEHRKLKAIRTQLEQERTG